MSSPAPTPDPRPGDRSLLRRRVAIAPLCLCLVAGVHLYRVATANQTPWKGGGFGMFSTVDSETARYLRCYLVRDDGSELPLAIPAPLARRAAELRAAPSMEAARQLAQRLVRRSWTQPIAERQAVAEAVRTAEPRGSLSAAELVAARRGAAAEVTDVPAGADAAVESSAGARGAVDGVPFRSVRVEVWKYDFDASRAELVGRKLLEVVESRPALREVQP